MVLGFLLTGRSKTKVSNRFFWGGFEVHPSVLWSLHIESEISECIFSYLALL